MHTSKHWLGAGLIALAGTAGAAAPSNEDLQKQIQALQQAVDALKQQLQAKTNEAAAAPAAVAAATDAEPVEVATKQDIDGIRADLENYKYDQQRNRDTKTALTKRALTLAGTVQVRASSQSQQTTSGTTATAEPRHTTFDVPSVLLNLSGSLFKDYSEGKNLDYKIGFSYAKNVNSGSVLATVAPNGSQLNLTDAYLVYSFFPTVAGLEEPKLTATFGQQQIPFGLEAQAAEELRPVINSAQFVNASGVGNRQIGLILRGDYDPYVDYGFNYRAPLIEYALGIVNGSSTNKLDDNGDQDYLARLAFTLPVDYNSWLRELKFGASYYKGTKNLVATPTIGAGAGTATLRATGKSDRYGVDIYYNHDPIGFTYEQVEGRDDLLINTTQAATTRKGREVSSRGQTFTGFYTWGQQWVKSYKGQAKYDDWWPTSYQAFVRWDKWDPNLDVGKDDTTIYTLGLNVFFAETTKLQVNLNQYHYGNPVLKTNNELLAQFQYGF
ncbi:hypothetical protein IGB42_00208 [Andreprevotia sp. IGB-42]|uniref:DUF3138 domain-containing protein n=1 Tax=Andreprevotia sp. IGB-42 TaxID=2497473 RepID=UPI0013596E1D|nr:DUF3138 domain-containing protein [Andreprevotia sp. IGB-42]KAF0815131.1 hypothetical protein IGB42_00208 [Andreprevotia sp. IGB-42]